jgi:GNAT superfamily N-acetyltransferase
LADGHVVAGFTCGKPALDTWIVERARTNQESGTSRTWVVTDESRIVVGYYASATGSLIRHGATPRAKRNQPEEIPAILLGRLAVDEKHRNAGLGSALLKHFILKSLEVAEIVGVRLLLVHAMDEEARNFYLHFDFESSPVDDLTLMLLLSGVEVTP